MSYSKVSNLISFVQYVTFSESGISIESLNFPTSPGFKQEFEITLLLYDIVLPEIKTESARTSFVSVSHNL